MRYESKLLERAEVAEGILAVRLERPKEFTFHPGQWCFLNLSDAGIHDDRGLRRHLSMATSPLDDDLQFATKSSKSAFKRTLGEMALGGEIGLEPPRGSLALPDATAEPIVFLAGGIGITPFRAMIRHASKARTGHRITLFYSNRRPEEAPFLGELLELAAAQENIRVVATMTRMRTSSRPWDGPTGRLSPELIREGCEEWGDARYFLAGPPPMVDAMKGVLDDLGVEDDRIQPEKFVGY